MGHDKLYRVGNKLLIFITMLSRRIRFQENSIFSSHPAWQTAVDDTVLQNTSWLRKLTSSVENKTKGRQREYAPCSCITQKMYYCKMYKTLCSNMFENNENSQCMSGLKVFFCLTGTCFMMNISSSQTRHQRLQTGLQTGGWLLEVRTESSQLPTIRCGEERTLPCGSI